MELLASAMQVSPGKFAATYAIGAVVLFLGFTAAAWAVILRKRPKLFRSWITPIAALLNLAAAVAIYQRVWDMALMRHQTGHW